jgi:uncharacterized membrane protein
MGAMSEPGDPSSRKGRYEDSPLSRQEYITVIVHFYRGEIQRSTEWRRRLDATTNWAVLTTAAMLSFFLADKTHEHFALLLSNLIILCYLLIEARRYRYFEVYRARVRMLEENFLMPVLTRRLESPITEWRSMVAQDLDRPKFKATLLEAIGFRLRRNYIYIFMIVLGAWFVKLLLHPTPAKSVEDLARRIAVPWLPTWLMVLGGVLFYALLFAVMWYARHVHYGEPEDEIAGLEQDLSQWKR